MEICKKNMAMDETKRGSMGREEREREVVVVCQTILLHTCLLLLLLCIRKCLTEGQIHRFLWLPLSFVGYWHYITSQMSSLPDVCCHMCWTWSCWTAHVLTAVSHHAVGAVDIHASHVLSHLKATKHIFLEALFFVLFSKTSRYLVQCSFMVTHLGDVPLKLLGLLHSINLLVGQRGQTSHLLLSHHPTLLLHHHAALRLTHNAVMMLYHHSTLLWPHYTLSHPSHIGWCHSTTRLSHDTLRTHDAILLSHYATLLYSDHAVLCNRHHAALLLSHHGHLWCHHRASHSTCLG